MTTVVCTACGFHNDADDQFCGGCQEYLEWTGEVLEEDAVEESVDDEPGPHRRGLVERVVDTFTGEGHDAPADRETASGKAAGPRPTAEANEAARREESVHLAEDAARRARESAQQAELAKDEAEAEAREHARRAEQARDAALEAERTKREAEEQARVEAEETEQLRHRLEEARAARRRAEGDLSAETRAAAEAREDATSQMAEEQARTERERHEVELRLAAEQAALEDARREVERAEEVRAAAEEAARHEAEAARTAQEAAEEAERARSEAEARAAQEAEEAERARRAAALVAPRRAEPPSTSPAATTTSRPPTKRPRRKPARETSSGESPSPDDDRDATTAARRPAAPVKPAATGPRRRGTTKEAPTRKLRPGDRVCGNCGEGNTPDRNFCRRCGATLAESRVVKRPWYARLLPTRRAAPTAGTRRERTPRQAGGAGRGARRLVRIVLLVVALVAAVAMWRNAVLREDVFDRAHGLYVRARSFFDAGTAVTLVDATASSQDPGGANPAGAAIDRNPGTHWTETSDGDGVGQSITVRFDSPSTVVGVVVTPGDPENFDAQPRPAQLSLAFDDGEPILMNLENISDAQPKRFFVEDAETVTVTVTDVHEGQEGSNLSITELEFREIA